MKKEAKQLYEKMVDFKRFAITVLAAGVFFYLGSILPKETKTAMDVTIMTFTSLSFLSVSIGLFMRSKQYRQKLLELDEGEEYLLRK